MLETIRISLGSARGPEISSRFVIHNPLTMSYACTSQVMRFGLIQEHSSLSGLVSGNRQEGIQKDLLAMIGSYGYPIEIVDPS